MRLEREHDNLRAALGWALQNREAELGARLALAVCWFWIDSGYHSDLRWWIDTLLELERAESPAGEVLPARTKAYLIQVAGIFAMAQGHHDRAVALHEESLDLYREMGHKKGESASLRELGFVAYEQGDYERALRLQEQSLALARVAVGQRKMERAAWLCGAVAALREDRGWPLPPARRAEHERTAKAIGGALGEEAFEAAWAKGHALPLEDAVRRYLALDGI